MSSSRRPWFPWYPKDYVSDEKTRGLSDDADLLYRRVLDIIWQANDLQLPSICSVLLNQIARGWSKERFEKAWEEIQRPGFELLNTSEDGKWITSNRLVREAQKIEFISKIRSENGRKAKAQQKPSKSSAKAKQKPSHTDTDTYIKENNTKENFRFKISVALPADFYITDQMSEYAKSKNYHGDLNTLTEDFIIHHKKKGSKFNDWYAAWQQWLRNDMKWHPEKANPQPEPEHIIPGPYVPQYGDE